MATVAIVNAYDDENRGSAALNLAAVELVRRSDPDAAIGLVTIRDFDASRRVQGYRHTLAEHPDVQVLPPLVDRRSLVAGSLSAIPAELLAPWTARRGLNEQTAEFLDSADLVVSRGGVIYHCRKGRKDLAGLLRRTSALRWAQRRGVPTSLIGLHVGAVHGAAATRVVRSQFARATVSHPRGALSEARLRSLSPSAHACRLPDSVFALRPALDRPAHATTGGRLLLVVSAPLAPYLGQVRSMVDELVAAGRVGHVAVALQVTDVDSDRPAVEQLLTSLDRDVELVDEDLSPRQLVDRYAQFDLLVSSRLHAAVFGLLAGVPSFPIDVSDDEKAVDVFGEIGLGDFVLTRREAPRWAQLVADRLDDAGTRVVRSVDEAHDRYSRVRVG